MGPGYHIGRRPDPQHRYAAPVNGHALVEAYTIYSCVIGSRAQGLATADSDTDRRGVYAVPAPLFWRLDKPPTHVEGPGPEQFFWELERLCVLALQANPTVYECLWSPVVEFAAPAGEGLLGIRRAFLSRRVGETFGNYARDQLGRVSGHLERTGEVRWKQAMHMIRLLLTGIRTLETGDVAVDVGPDRDRLLAVKRGEVSWDEVRTWAARLGERLATTRTAIPVEPDRATVDDFLVTVRRESL